MSQGGRVLVRKRFSYIEPPSFSNQKKAARRWSVGAATEGLAAAAAKAGGGRKGSVKQVGHGVWVMEADKGGRKTGAGSPVFTVPDLELTSDFCVAIYDQDPAKKRRMLSCWLHPLGIPAPTKAADPLANAADATATAAAAAAADKKAGSSIVGGAAPDGATRMVRLPKAELDGACADEAHKKFAADFWVEAFFSDSPPADARASTKPGGSGGSREKVAADAEDDDSDEEGEEGADEEGAEEGEGAEAKGGGKPGGLGKAALKSIGKMGIKLDAGKMVRHLVSKKKRRFQEDGFDLDLAYITPRIIAMGFPSEQIEGVYRNPMAQVAQLLETRHKDHYMVYNLCSERSYEPGKFKGRVQAYPFDDHNPPPLKLVGEFCENVKAWFDEHPDNVVAVHCKAGKGRTGVMISAQLLHERMYAEADDALAFYGFARTNNCEGVTIPSQRTYVHYYAHLCAEESLRQRLADKTLAYVLRRLRVVALPSSVPRKADKCELCVRLRHPHRDDVTLQCRDARMSEVADPQAELSDDDRAELPGQPPKYKKAQSKLAAAQAEGKADAKQKVLNAQGEHVGTKMVAVAEFELGAASGSSSARPDGAAAEWVVQGDVRVELLHKDEELCHFWFNTATLTRPRLVRHKWQLDGGPGKDGKHKKYHSAFRLELDLEQTTPPMKKTMTNKQAAKAIAEID